MSNGLEVSTSERNKIANEKTAQEERIEREEKYYNTLKQLAEDYFKFDKNLQKKLQSLRLSDVAELNNRKSRIDDKYEDLVRRGILTKKQAQIKAYKEFDQTRRLIDSRRRIDEKREELELSKSRLAIRRQEIDEIKQLEKAARQEEYSARIKELEDLKKKRREIIAAGGDTSKIDKKISRAEKSVEKQKDKIDKANPAEARLGVKGELKDVGKQLAGGITGTLDELGSFLKGDTSKDALKERAEAGDKIAEATLKNIDELEDKMNSFVNGIKELLSSYIQEYSSYQGKVNARLQGSGSGWNSINNRLNNSVGANPYVKLSKMLENVSAAVEAGIAYNVEQRAFLQTVSENIATTFDAFNANLLRIIRLQQNDSTAARMGLEASLTNLFNTYFSDTSYLSDSFDNVSASLTEAIAQMGTKEGVAFEYAVQKWLGSLYSVGMSDSAISSIATALGQLGSGDVSGLAGNSAMQNLIVMAASRAGLSYADMLTGGLTAQTTNTLLASMVDYLQEIAESDNKIIKSQYSQIFGLTSADLVAAKNLGSTVASLAQNTLDYSGAVNELYYQMNQLPTRLSVGEMTGNLIDNVKYTLAQGIANNPVTYALWEMTDMIEELSGGLQLPVTSVLGNSFDLKTSLTNLARLGIAGAGLLGNVGTIINGVDNTFNPSGMLTQLGITTSAASNAVTRGGGLGRRQAVTNQVSSSTTVGNASGEDYEASLTAQAKDKENAAVEAKQEEAQTKSINDIHEYLLQVFDPKITGITRMLGVLSGTDTSKQAEWGSFKTKDDISYAATSIKIENVGETNMASQNAEYMKKISDNVENIYTLLSKGELKVTVLNYGLTGGNTTTPGGGISG